jgi:hypothetical protein
MAYIIFNRKGKHPNTFFSILLYSFSFSSPESQDSSHLFFLLMIRGWRLRCFRVTMDGLISVNLFAEQEQVEVHLGFCLGSYCCWEVFLIGSLTFAIALVTTPTCFYCFTFISKWSTRHTFSQKASLECWAELLRYVSVLLKLLSSEFMKACIPLFWTSYSG